VRMKGAASCLVFGEQLERRWKAASWCNVGPQRIGEATQRKAWGSRLVLPRHSISCSCVKQVVYRCC
jgi:hypothetical protein